MKNLQHKYLHLLSAIVATVILITSTITVAATSITMQSSTSIADSGLYDYLLPLFKQDAGVTVYVVAVGTGQAFKNAANCDGDLLLVHAKESEIQFVAAGYGVRRYDVMYNDFIFVGPKNDPAIISNIQSAVTGLKQIAIKKSLFVSRGDNSGTHTREMMLWKKAKTDPRKSGSEWYREVGAGMGATLNVAIGMGAYTIADRATWANFKNKQDYKILLAGDDQLINQYGVIKVNPARCRHAQSEEAQSFIDWLLSKKGQGAIAAYRLNGQQVFFPNAVNKP